MISLKGKVWYVTRCSDNEVKSLAIKYNLPWIVAQTIQGRKIADVEAFLDPKVKNLLIDPDNLLNMARAVDIIWGSIQNNKRILIWGDYDVDGVSSTSMLIRFFLEVGFTNFSYHVPDRKTEGYGMAGLDLSMCGDIDTILAVDCGTTDFAKCEEVKNSGRALVVIDHHAIDGSAPKCDAFINPKQSGDESGLTALCAAGLTFMFIVALNRQIRKERKSYTEPDLMKYLSIAALATVCDVVPLVGLNRAIVRTGISLINSGRTVPGVKCISDIHCRCIDSGAIGFVLGPRINAAGRIDNAKRCVKLFTSDDIEELQEICADLEMLNDQRKEIEAEVLRASLREAEKQKDRMCLMIASENFDPGVIGIVASRIVENTNKPCAIVSIRGDIGKGSCRSTDSFNIGSALAKLQDLLICGGGHAKAGGFTVRTEDLPALHNKMEALVMEGVQEQTKISYADLEVALSSVNQLLVDYISRLEPFGECNREPVFMLKNLRAGYIKIFAEKHLSTSVIDESGYAVQLTIFNYSNFGPNLQETLASQFTLLACIYKDEYRRCIALRAVDVIPQ